MSSDNNNNTFSLSDNSTNVDLESGLVTNDNLSEYTDTQQQQPNESDDLLINNTNSTLNNLRESATRRISLLGLHFNILDRLFKRNNNTHNNNDFATYGASYDGVFSNLSAKPTTNESNLTNLEDIPPSYDEAANDMAPSYYNGAGDGSGMYYDEICIEGLPVGNFANLLWNIIVSTCFQFAGFLITYVLHTSHAAKQGSRLGLGLTFTCYAYSMIPNDVTSKVGKYKKIDRLKLNDPMEFDNLHLYSKPTEQDNFESNLGRGLEEEKQKLPLLAICVALFGIYIICKSIYDYVKVKKMESRYLAQDQA